MVCHTRQKDKKSEFNPNFRISSVREFPGRGHGEAEMPVSVQEKSKGRDRPGAEMAYGPSRFSAIPLEASGTGMEEIMGSAGWPGAFIRLPLRGFVHPVARDMAVPGVKFRLPEFARVKAAYEDPDLKIPEAVIKNRVTILLMRMEKEKKLKSNDPVPVIVSKIFPTPGVIDETEFNNALDVMDRNLIYKSITDAYSRIKREDIPAFRTMLKDAAADVQTAASDNAGLAQVFGSKDQEAKRNYGKIGRILRRLAAGSAAIARGFTTDYNLDDSQVVLGGYANFGSQTMHLEVDVVKVKDPKESRVTVIHEAAHLAGEAIDDYGYYGKSGFFELEEEKKIVNAAHYEELPRRILNTSIYPNLIFTPGKDQSGKPMTRDEKIRVDVSEYLRMAWDAAVDVHQFLRYVRWSYLEESKWPFIKSKKLILEISRLMDLTIHEQAEKKAIVTTLDLTLTESIARAVMYISEYAKSVPFPNPVGNLTDEALKDKIVEEAVKTYGNLMQSKARDKILLDWLSDHYRKVWPD